MKVLIACEFSGVVRDAFLAKGHDAISCDLLPTDSPGPHYQGDVKDILNENWDLMIAHPPCTYLCNAGSRWLYNKDKTLNLPRWESLQQAYNFFNFLLNQNIPKICVENPIMHKHAKEKITIPYTQIIQPWQFGEPESKATCLWLKNLPKLSSTNIIKPNMIDIGNGKRMSNMFVKSWYGNKKERAKIRSKTFQGIANAMADQWNF